MLAKPTPRDHPRVMTEQPQTDSADPAPAAAAASSSAPRRHRFSIGALFVLATIVAIVAAHAVWLNRQALNTDN
jgi:hypothetical protein